MTDDINDVRHTSTLAKFEEAVRRSSPGSDSGMAVYSELPEAIRVHLLELETFIGDCDGQWTALQTSDENVVLDNGTIDASGAVKAFNGIVAALHSSDHAQNPAEPGMQGAVQYRRKDGGYGPRWITMAMFDGTLAAESYCNLQRKDDKWPFEYRAIELPAVADTSTDRGPQKDFKDTFSAETVLLDAFFPSTARECGFCGGPLPCLTHSQGLSQPSPVWPEGCRDGNSCARHKACMYVKCRHNGRSIAGEVEAAIADTRPLRPGEPK